MSALEPMAAAVGGSVPPPTAAASFLVEAGRILTSSLDYETTIRNISRLFVPSIADYCIVRLLSEAGQVRTITLVHTDPTRDALLRELDRQQSPEQRRLDHLSAKAFAARKPLLISPVTDSWIRRIAVCSEHERLLRALGPRTIVIAPLRGRERMLGTISLGITTPGRTFSPQWIDVLDDLSRWVAVAIENALLHTEIRQKHAATLDARARLERLQTLTAALASTLTIEDVARVATEQCAIVLGANNSLIARLDTARNELECFLERADDGVQTMQTRLPLTARTPLATTVRENRPYFCESWDEVLAAFPDASARLKGRSQSLACLPLTVGSERVGGLVLGFTEMRTFSESDRSMFVALAQQCAQALWRAELHERLRRALTESERSADRIARLQAVTAGLSAALTAEQVAEVVVKASIATTGAQAGAVYAYDAETESFVLLSQTGYRADDNRYTRIMANRPGPLQDALALRQPIIVENVEEMLARWPTLRVAQADSTDQAFISLPLIVDQRPLGVLHLASREPRAFPPEEQELLHAIARQCAQALDRARLYDAEQRQRATAEAAMLQTARLQDLTAELSRALTPEDVAATIITHGRLALDAAAIAVLAHDPVRRALTVVDAAGFPADVLQHFRDIPIDSGTPIDDAIRAGHAIWLGSRSDFTERYQHFTQFIGDRSHSWAAVPLMVGERVIGGLTLSFDRPMAFDAEQRAHITTLAQQCAQALDRARLFEAAQREQALAERTAARTAQLQEITAALSSAVTPEQVGEVIVTRGLAAIGAYAGTLVTCRSDSTDLDITYSRAYRFKTAPMGRLPADYPMLVTLPVRTGEPVWVGSRAELAERFPDRLAAVQAVSQSWAAVPLMIEGRVIGALGLSFRQPNPFPPEDRAFILALAEQAAQAIERSRLYVAAQTARTEAEAATQRLRLLAEASERLAASLAYRETLEQVARLAVPSFADLCCVDLVEGEAPSCLTVSHVLPEKEALVVEFRRRFPVAEDPRHPVHQVLATGQSYLLESCDTTRSRQIGRSPEERALLDEIGIRSVIVVPLRSRGRTFGTLTFAITESDRRYDKQDLALAEDLARRAAVAIDNAALCEAQQEAIRVRDQFLSIAAHELKTPVTSLRGFAQLVLRQFSRDRRVEWDQVRRALEIIDLQSSKLARLLSQLLDVSRLNADRLELERETLDLVELARTVVATSQAAAREHTLVLEAPEPVCASVDPIRIEQVLANLLDNAVKFSPSLSTVRIEVGRTADGAARITVTDAGIGVPPEHRERIFDRFYQAHTGAHTSGMGLGLYISRQIVELHGGRLEAQFPVEGGTRFVVTLPG